MVDILKSGAIGSTEGYTGFMRAFARQIVNGLWLTDLASRAAGKAFRSTGAPCAPSWFPLYLRRLNQEPVMQGREIGSLQIGAPKAGPPGCGGRPGPTRAPLPRIQPPIGRAGEGGESAMKEQGKRFADRIDGMTLRERGMIFVMVAVVLLAVLNSVLLDPLFAKQKLLSQRIEQQQGETKSLGIQIQGLVQARGQDPTPRTMPDCKS